MTIENHFLIITPTYPSAHGYADSVFVRVFARNLVQLGVETTVVSPSKYWRYGDRPEPDRLSDEDEPSIVRPRYLPFSSRIIPLVGSTFPWTIRSFCSAARRAASFLESPISHVYGHFLFPAGLAAVGVASETGARSVVALGESSLEFYERHMSVSSIKAALQRIDQVIAVSEEIRSRCVERYSVSGERVAVFPNAAGPGFTPMCKSRARETLGLPQDRTIVGFIGQFNLNKGTHRVMNAVRNIPEIDAFFLGQGQLKPEGEQVLFAGPVPHSEVPVWLSAADLFVNCSIMEGSSNALAEAMACGLPIVATDIPANREMLNNRCAEFVEPFSVRSLSETITTVVRDPERLRCMSEASLQAAKGYTSLDRAENILDWITNR